MLRSGRRALRVSTGILAALVCAAVICLDGVDYQPYFRTPYYRETVAHLRTATNKVLTVSGELEAGFGRARLNPTLNVLEEQRSQGIYQTLPLAGYGDRKGGSATGTHDDLFVKAVAFRVLGQIGVMIAADTLIIPPEVAEIALDQLQTRFSLARHQVYFGATHTHASLGGWGEGWVAEAFAGGFKPGVREWIAGRMVEAVGVALTDLTPAALGEGSFFAPEHVRNRLVGDLGRVDSEFSFLAVRQAGGRLGLVGTYGAHATVLPSGNMQFSGDYPGAWQRQIESETAGLAVFVAGGVGSHGPVAGAPGYAGVERMGEGLAREALENLSRVAFTNRISFGCVGLDVTLPPLHIRVSDGLRLRPWLARRVIRRKGEGTFLQAFRLQNSVWVSTPCDYSGELVLGLKDSFRAQGVRVVVTSFNGDYIGYVVPSRYYHLEGYEPRLMSFFGPTVPDYLDELIHSLASAVVRP